MIIANIVVKADTRRFAYWKTIQRVARNKNTKVGIQDEQSRVFLSDELEMKLRFKTIEKLGGRKGDLSQALEEAVKTWVETCQKMREKK